jgi:hypothetical protein
LRRSSGVMAGSCVNISPNWRKYIKHMVNVYLINFFSKNIMAASFQLLFTSIRCSEGSAIQYV